MSSPFKMNPGRGPMKKTGRGIPETMCSPATHKNKHIRDIAKNVATVHNSGGNVNAYTSPGSKYKSKNKNYIGKKTSGITAGAAYDATELSDAALLNYGDGLIKSRDSISSKQVYDILKSKGRFNSNAYTADPNQNYDQRNDFWDESPLEQARDAISGKKLTGKEDFGNTKKSIDSEGNTVYTTPYSTKGTPGTANKMPDADWTKLVAERKAKGKGPINPPGSRGSVTKGTKGTSGSVVSKTFTAKPASIKPLAISFDNELSKVPLSRKKGDVPFEPIHGQSGLKTFERGLKKPKGFFSGVTTKVKDVCIGGLAQ